MIIIYQNTYVYIYSEKEEEEPCSFYIDIGEC